MRAADLHIHTTASDGSLTPAEVVNQASLVNLNYISLTDHDTVNGLVSLPPAVYSAKRKVTVIPGIELSTDLNGREVHLLGYYIDINNRPLLSKLNELTQERIERMNGMIKRLVALGYNISWEQVARKAGSVIAFGRPHLARALIDNGYFSNINAVFETILAKDGPVYLPHRKLRPEQAILLIKGANGLPVLAHPGLIGNRKVMNRLIDSGIEGLEVYHPCHTKSEIADFLAMGRRHNLLITGGSDFHGLPGRFPAALGDFTVDEKLIGEFLNKNTMGFPDP